MTIKVTAAAMALALSVGAAQGATIGEITFDDDAFADAVAVVSGDPFDTDFSGMLNGSNQSFGNIGTSNNAPVIEVSFTDNVVFNGDGVDMYVYVPGEVFAVVAGLTSDFLPDTSEQSSLVDPDSLVFFDTPVNPFGFNPNSGLLAIDLDDFGLAAGAELSSFFLQRGDIEGAIYGVGAVNSRSVDLTPPQTVPLPAGILLLLGALGLLRELRWGQIKPGT